MNDISNEVKFKVRLAARGDLCHPKEEKVTYSPRVSADETKMFIIALSTLKCFVLQEDVLRRKRTSCFVFT